MNYYILDTKNHLETVGTIGLYDVLSELNVSKSSFEQMLNQESFRFREHFILVETKFHEEDPCEEKEESCKEKKEQMQCIEESKCNQWYVSDFGKVYVKNKTKNKIKEIKPRLRKGVVEVQYRRHTVNLKNLVAKHFLPDWTEKCIVRYKNDKTPFDCSSQNLYIECTRKEFSKRLQHNRVCTPVTQYINGKKVRTWNSITEAADALYYSRHTIAQRLREGRNQFDTFELYYAKQRPYRRKRQPKENKSISSNASIQ